MSPSNTGNSVHNSGPGINRLPAAGILLLAVFFWAGLFWIESQSGYAGISNRTVPLLVAVGLTVCGLLLFVRRDSVLLKADEAAEGQQPQVGRLLWLMAGLLLTILLIGMIGFPLASVILMVCVARGYQSRQPLRDAIVSLCITLPLWFIFTKLLAINLPLLPLAGL